MRTSADNFSRKQRAEICLRAKGSCENCGAHLKVGEGEAHHDKPVNDGGRPDIANGRWLCKPCHREITTGYVRETRKAERVRDRHTGAMLKSARPLPCGKGSRLKRKLNGQIVER
jgi:5-methylcytosine-specific restriction endonuclease McrA